MQPENSMHKTKLTMLLHVLEKLDDHFGARPDEDLSLPPLLRVINALQRIGEYGHTNLPLHNSIMAKIFSGTTLPLLPHLVQLQGHLNTGARIHVPLSLSAGTASTNASHNKRAVS